MHDIIHIYKFVDETILMNIELRDFTYQVNKTFLKSVILNEYLNSPHSENKRIKNFAITKSQQPLEKMFPDKWI